MDDQRVAAHKLKSFHVDTYRFDSRPEIEYFFHTLKDPNIEEVYFLGMFTSGQSDFL